MVKAQSYSDVCPSRLRIYEKTGFVEREIEEACKTDIRFMWILGH